MGKPNTNLSRLLDFSSTPPLPTAKRQVYVDGRVRGSDGSVWAGFAVPMSPTVEAKTTDLRLNASAPLLNALSGLASTTPVSGLKRRSVAKSGYREIQLLSVNLQHMFQPPPTHPNRERLLSFYGDAMVDVRRLLLFIKLVPSMFSHGLKGAFDSVAATFVEAGAPLNDFDADFVKISKIMDRAGLASARPEDISLADTWWNGGGGSAVPVMPEPDCFHVFSTMASARAGARLYERGLPADEWPELDGHHVLRFGSVESLDLGWSSALDAQAGWWEHLIDQGAVAVSLRGRLEPGVITAAEFDTRRNAYLRDIEERHREGKLGKPELEEKQQTLEYLRTLYRGNNPPPTVSDASIVFAMPYSFGPVEELHGGFSAMMVAEMTSRQAVALAEMWPSSPVRANPNRLEIPATTLAYSGCVSLSRVGDRTDRGVVIGFSERDRQTAWFDPRAAMDQDAPPLFGVYGQSGSGKTMLGLLIGVQYSWQAPVIFVNPKPKSSLAHTFEYFGGQVVRLDELLSADGILDPLRFGAGTPDGGIEMAVMMLADVNPWGTNLADFETPLQIALRYGVDCGHRSIGTALHRALTDGVIEPDLSDLANRVLGLARADSLFRAMCGLSDNGPSLVTDNRLTLIEVGDVSLPLPNPGAEAITQSQRVAINLVRMIVRGSISALAGSDGLVLLDEAWVFLGSSPAELDQTGRLARSQRVVTGLMTQKVSDAQAADMEEYLTTGFIGHMKTHREAAAACQLSHLEPTEERLARITTPPVIEGQGSRRNNWGSMRALMRLDERGHPTREVERGAIFIFSDMYDQAIPVEVVLPDEFLKVASTNIRDRG